MPPKTSTTPKKTPKTAAKTKIANGDAQTAGNGSHSHVEEELIRRRAYELYEQRGKQHGRHHEDWFRAEAEVGTQRKTS